MKKGSEKVIQNHLNRMAQVFQDTAGFGGNTEKRIMRSFFQKVQKLADVNFNETVPAEDDMSGESVEKVGYFIDLALKTFQKISHPHLEKGQQAKFIYILSETYETLGSYESALQNYKIALDFAAEQNSRLLQGQIQFRMACIYGEMGKWSDATRLLQQAIAVMRAISDFSGIALSQLELAKIAYRKGEYAKAQKLFESALETSESVNDVAKMATVNNHLGMLLRMQGKYDDAFHHFQKALIDFQSIQDARGSAESLNNLGVIHLRNGDLREATGYFEKALRLCQDSGNLPSMAFIYLNKTEFYIEVGDYPMAATACGRALEILVRLKNPIGIAKANNLLGRIFWKSDDLETARIFYEESIQFYKEFWVPLGLANCYREFAEMLTEKGNREEVSTMLEQANEIYKNLGVEVPVLHIRKNSAPPVIINSNVEESEGAHRAPSQSA